VHVDDVGACTDELPSHRGPSQKSRHDAVKKDVCRVSLGIEPGSWRHDPQLRAELDAANRRHRFRFHDVEHLEASPANIDQLASVIAEGDAIWAAFRVGDSWSFGQVSDGVFDDYEAPVPSPGHAVALVGYRTTATSKQFLIKNSWSRSWGRDGFAWMPEHVLRKHLYRAFRLRASPSAGQQRDRRKPPSRQLACAPGQLRDLVTGACSTPCAGLFPPVNGICAFAMPARTASTGCCQSQVRDLLTGTCRPRCANGFPPAMGICLP